jgi:hypothetical protein
MVCKSIVSNAMHFYNIGQKELDAYARDAEKGGRQADRISVSQTLKHFVRDWADEGSKERSDAFPCILSTVADLKSKLDGSTSIKILLPGSGLGRLGHEVANLGVRLSSLWLVRVLILCRFRSHLERMVHVHECGLQIS